MDQLIDIRAFTLGMLALLNPCGFALLPAYLGFFLAGEDDDKAVAGRPRWAQTLLSLNRAQVVGLTMSAGFMAVFGALGVVLAGALNALESAGVLPYVTMAMGVGLVAMGIAMLAGYQPIINGLKINRGGTRSLKGMFLFGVSYAVASISCTIGLFAGTVTASSANGSFLGQFGAFLSYGLGMGLLATVLTLAVGLGRTSVVNVFRSSLGVITKVSAALLVVVGIYVTLYGVFEVQLLSPGDPTPWVESIVLSALDWQSAAYNWVGEPINPFELLTEPVSRAVVMGSVFLVINLVVLVGAAIVRRLPASGPTGGGDGGGGGSDDELVAAA